MSNTQQSKEVVPVYSYEKANNCHLIRQGSNAILKTFPLSPKSDIIAKEIVHSLNSLSTVLEENKRLKTLLNDLFKYCENYKDGISNEGLRSEILGALNKTDNL